MRGLTVMLLLLAAGAAAADEPSSQQQPYYRAIGLGRAGQPGQALELLDRLSAEHPEDRFADDALFKGAELCERQLLDLEGALARYRKLTERYPRSRLFRRARKRLDYLSANRAAGDEVLLRFEKVVRETPLSDLERTRAGVDQLLALLEQHPRFPQAPRARFWVAEARFKLGQREQAFADLRELARRYPGTEWALRARYREGDALMSRREFARAREVYLAAGPKARGAAENAATWLWRQRIAIGGLAAYLLVLAALLVRSRIWRRPGALWPPPGETVFLGPLVVLLVVLAYARSSVFWMPIGALGMTGLVLLSLGGYSFRVRPPARASVLLWALLVLAGGAGLAYGILYHFDLLRSVVHTWQFGADG